MIICSLSDKHNSSTATGEGLGGVGAMLMEKKGPTLMCNLYDFPRYEILQISRSKLSG